MTVRFRDRRDAGARLAAKLSAYAGRPDVVVLALPRGGVPVGAAVAAAVSAPLDVLVVRKLGVPGHEELAMGAIASGGVRVLNAPVLDMLGGTSGLDEVTERELTELRRREQLYRGDRPPLDVAGKLVVLVDDGLATGSTMEAAVRAVRQRGPRRVLVAAPVGSPSACDRLRELADEVRCLATPPGFRAVGLYYDDFGQTSDDEVRDLLGFVDAGGGAR